MDLGVTIILGLMAFLAFMLLSSMFGGNKSANKAQSSSSNNNSSSSNNNSSSGNNTVKKKSSFVASTRFADEYATLEQVSTALRTAGLEACQLIVGVDFTKSNLEQGTKTFAGRSLHDVAKGRINPYERVLQAVCRTLSAFDDDNLIPAYYFGDTTTRGSKCGSFLPEGRPCNGLEEVLTRYRQLAATLQLSGPTNFAPLIHEAMRIVRQTKEYHVLVIVADGQVTNVDETEKAIVEASSLPLQILIIGVGDGPWDEAERMDDDLPDRTVDNLQFVNSASILDYNREPTEDELAKFAVAALQEVPQHFQACRKLKLM